MLTLVQPANGFFSEKTMTFGAPLEGMTPYITDNHAQQLTGVMTAKTESLSTPTAPKTDVSMELLAKTAVLMNYYAKLLADTLKLTLLYLYAVSKKYTPLVLNAMGDALVRSFNALNYYGEVLANRTRLCWARLTGYGQFDDEQLLKYIQQNIDVLYEDFMHVAQGHYCSTVDQDALVEQENIYVDIGHFYSGGKHSFAVDVKNMDTLSILDIAKCIAIKQEIEEQVANGGSLPPVEAMNYIFAHRGTLAKPVVEQSFDELSTLLPNR